MELEFAIQQLVVKGTLRTCYNQALCSYTRDHRGESMSQGVKDLTLASRSVRIAVTDLTTFLPIRSFGGLAGKVSVLPIRRGAQCQDAYAWLHVMRTHRLQRWPSRFCCDPFFPFTLSSHLRSELCLLNPETLKRTHQGIVRNGKQFKT
ncbi:hypothetical protein PIB30_055262 [Stylosanthes scabra]|uniref:Uncharacterized protein n=1 Tax=Stylosanthes scabra TaxID=79078 RepID=A0ABU6QJS8_9FABA|nr:hypothetical protein [Stylosanthes scabra]